MTNKWKAILQVLVSIKNVLSVIIGLPIGVVYAWAAMTEDEYRAMLSGFGVESSRLLTQGKFERVMRHFEKIGFRAFAKASAGKQRVNVPTS